jgi:hypothetical protein
VDENGIFHRNSELVRPACSTTAAQNIVVNTENRLIGKVDFGMGLSLNQAYPVERPRMSRYRLNVVIGLPPELSPSVNRATLDRILVTRAR